MLTKFGYEHMKPMMLEYSERELSKFLMMKREVWMSMTMRKRLRNEKDPEVWCNLLLWRCTGIL